MSGLKSDNQVIAELGNLCSFCRPALFATNPTTTSLPAPSSISEVALSLRSRVPVIFFLAGLLVAETPIISAAVLIHSS